MKNDKSKNIIIGLLVVIIIILGTLVVLFVTGTISFNNNLENTNNQTSENNDLNESITNNELNDNQILESNKTVYSDVIDEYKQVILEGYKENNNYKYINEYAVNTSSNIQYSFYDINKDGKYEMLINNSIVDIFSYDGTDIIRLFKEDSDCLAYGRCSMELYEDGTIYMRGSGGASRSYINFYSINKNISTLNTINSYALIYGEDGGLTIFDGKTFDYANDTGTKLNYSSDTELLNANIHNTKKVDLNKLNWNKFN